MAEYNELFTLTLEAAADLSLFQYCGVRISAQYRMNVASDPGASSYVGVLQTKPRQTEFGTVAYLGKSKMVAGGAITAGALITINSSGRAAPVASGGMTIGQALDTSSADGDIISVLLKPAFRQAGAI